jgi:hypothetical protein
MTRARKTIKGTWYGSPAYEMLRGARYRAKRRNVSFDLVLSDIVIPALCPVFGTPLIPTSQGRPGTNSPSLDRIVSEYGYIKSNVRVISYRANVLKRDASIAELELVLRYMRKELGCT